MNSNNDNLPVAVPIQRRLVTWDPATGAPLVTTAPMFSKAQIADIVSAAASSPYEDPLGLEPEFAGMSNIEVMLIKLSRHAAQTGNVGEIESLLDRILGRPKQSTEVTKMELGYEDYLKEIERREALAAKPPPEAAFGDIFG